MRFVLALSVFVLSGFVVSRTVSASPPRVESATATYNSLITEYGVVVHDLPLSRPLSMEGATFVLIDGVAHDARQADGGTITYSRMSLRSSTESLHEEVQVFTRTTGRVAWTSQNRTGTDLRPSSAVANTLRIRQETKQFLSRATSIDLTARGSHPGDEIVVHVVYGDRRFTREAVHPPLTWKDTGASDWIEKTFDSPVPAWNVELIYPEGGFEYTWDPEKSGMIVQMELLLDDGQAIRLDDMESPSTDVPIIGRASSTHSLFLSPERRANWRDRDFVSWRWRIVREGEGASSVTSDRQEIHFFLGIGDCDGDGELNTELCDPNVLFWRGDVDGDGQRTIADAIRILTRLFLGSGPLSCTEAADADQSGQLGITDAVYLLGFMFLGSDAPTLERGCESAESAALDCVIPGCLQDV